MGQALFWGNSLNSNKERQTIDKEKNKQYHFRQQQCQKEIAWSCDRDSGFRQGRPLGGGALEGRAACWEGASHANREGKSMW